MGPQTALRLTPDSARPDASAVTFERVLNTEEAAALLQIHPKTLQKMAREGTVPAFRIGDLWRFRASAPCQAIYLHDRNGCRLGHIKT
jgi:excisionase family DNA binding protein